MDLIPRALELDSDLKNCSELLNLYRQHEQTLCGERYFASF